MSKNEPPLSHIIRLRIRVARYPKRRALRLRLNKLTKQQNHGGKLWKKCA